MIREWLVVPSRPMKKFIIFSISIMLLVSCKFQETITVEEVRSAINRFDESWRNKNSQAVDSLLSPSYSYFTQSGGTFSRSNVVKTAASKEYKLEKLVRDQYEIKIEGNTAVVNTIWAGKGSYYEDPFNDRQRCSVTLIKQNGKIEILSEHCTPVK